MRKNLLNALALVTVLTGCTTDFPEASLVDKLRVLAISADRPEVLPGETVAINALVVGVDPATVTYEWRACPLTEQGRGFFGGGAGLGTSGGGAYSLESPGTCFELEAIAPELVYDLGSAATAEVTIPDDILSDESVGAYYGFGTGGLPELVLNAVKMVAGVNYTVNLRVRAGDEVLDAFKRINVSSSPDPNVNPENIAFSLRLAGTEAGESETGQPKGPGECLIETDRIQGKELLIRPLNIPENLPEYQVIGGTTNIDEPFGLFDTKESLFYSYFSTHGSLSRRRTKSEGQRDVRWTFEELPSEAVDLWIVVRDGRGGVAWCHSRLAN